MKELLLLGIQDARSGIEIPQKEDVYGHLKRLQFIRSVVETYIIL